MSLFVMTALLLQIAENYALGYDCQYNFQSTSTISCVNMDSKADLKNDITTLLVKEQVVSLNISNSKFYNINETVFKGFESVKNLYLNNCTVTAVEDNTFFNMTKLESIDLSNNYLTNITSNISYAGNKIKTINLSNNLINDLAYFNISRFPNLLVLNVSNNNLSYLPEYIINKLLEENKLYLVIDNNPWDCNDTRWEQHLSEELVFSLCVNNTYNVVLKQPIDLSEENQARAPIFPNTDPDYCTLKCSFYSCHLWCRDHEENSQSNMSLKSSINMDTFSFLRPSRSFCAKNCTGFWYLWLSGGIFGGVILGNLCFFKRVISKLLCPPRPVEYVERASQSDYVSFRQPVLK